MVDDKSKKASNGADENLWSDENLLRQIDSVDDFGEKNILAKAVA